MIHRVHSTDLGEINRILALIQQGGANPVRVSTGTPGGSGGSAVGGGGSGSGGAQGPPGPTGPAGPSGSSDLSLVLMGETEVEDILTDNSGSVIWDEDGFAVTQPHTQYDIVTDDFGVILTAE